MSNHVYITAVGINTALGRGVSAQLDAFANGKSGMRPIAHLKDLRKPFLGGEVDSSNEEIRADLTNQKAASEFTRAPLLALTALEDLLSESNFTANERAAFLNSTTVGGMDFSEHEFLYHGDKKNFSKFLNHSVGQSTRSISSYFGWKIYETSISTACSSSANTIMLGARMILSGKYDQVIAGGMESLSHFTINGFDSLMIYDSEHCRPYDETREGLNLGEGAAFVMLESEESAKRSGNKIIAKVSGWANANDAHHQTASSPDGQGAYLAMDNALKVAGIKAEDIDYVNAHGTGTKNNDLSESTAFNRIFKEMPVFSSTKSFTGHTLAASGAIEAVFATMAINNDVVLPHLNFKTPITETGLSPLSKLTKKEGINHILSNSFGFGGNNSTLIISR